MELVSPSVTSRLLVSNAASLLDESYLNLMEADGLKAVYAIGKSVRYQRITSYAKPTGMRKNNLLSQRILIALMSEILVEGSYFSGVSWRMPSLLDYCCKRH
jgi:hypothetical protein